jgi:hypothetical protein
MSDSNTQQVRYTVSGAGALQALEFPEVHDLQHHGLIAGIRPEMLYCAEVVNTIPSSVILAISFAVQFYLCQCFRAILSKGFTVMQENVLGKETSFYFFLYIRPVCKAVVKSDYKPHHISQSVSLQVSQSVSQSVRPSIYSFVCNITTPTRWIFVKFHKRDCLLRCLDTLLS